MLHSNASMLLFNLYPALHRLMDIAQRHASMLAVEPCHVFHRPRSNDHDTLNRTELSLQ
jgi:hypothetical protein